MGRIRRLSSSTSLRATIGLDRRSQAITLSLASMLVLAGAFPKEQRFAVFFRICLKMRVRRSVAMIPLCKSARVLAFLLVCEIVRIALAMGGSMHWARNDFYL